MRKNSRTLFYIVGLAGLMILPYFGCKEELISSTIISSEMCTYSEPDEETVLFGLKEFSFDGSTPANKAEAEKILKFLCSDVSIHYPTSQSICGLFKSGYHLTLWIENYGATDRYGARYGSESDHSYFSSNYTYFEILKPIGKLISATTLPATSVTANTAKLNGTINANNLNTTVVFEYGLTTAFGQSVNATPGTVTGNVNTAVSAEITGLTANKKYYFRVNAKRSSGVSIGSILNFTTSAAVLSTLTTASVSGITASVAVCGGVITSDGGSPVTERGLCWATTTNPTITTGTKISIGTGIGTFTGNMTGLSSRRTYYVRAYAINSVGTAYGNQVSFTTL